MSFAVAPWRTWLRLRLLLRLVWGRAKPLRFCHPFGALLPSLASSHAALAPARWEGVIAGLARDAISSVPYGLRGKKRLGFLFVLLSGRVLVLGFPSSSATKKSKDLFFFFFSWLALPL